MFLKKIMLLFSMFLGTTAFAQPQPCLTIYRSNSEFFKAVLEVSSSDLTNVALERSGSTATARVTTAEGLETYKVKQLCNGSVVAEAVKVDSEYICKEYVNCMPIVAEENQKYCTKEYVEWTKSNCDVEVRIVY